MRLALWFKKWRMKRQISWRLHFIRVYKTLLKFLDGDDVKDIVIEQGEVHDWLKMRKSCREEVQRLETEIEGILNGN